MRYLALIVLLMITFACSSNDIKVADSEHKEPTREELRKAMRYHGILIAMQDEKNHEWYFIRDGKRCSLFSYLKNRQRRTS